MHGFILYPFTDHTQFSFINFFFHGSVQNHFWNFYSWMNPGIYIFTSSVSSKFRICWESPSSAYIWAFNQMVHVLKFLKSHTFRCLTAELHSLNLPPDNEILLALQFLTTIYRFAEDLNRPTSIKIPLYM